MIRLEVCVDSPQGLLAAAKGGADRIELCAALALGGLTPNPGLIALATEQQCPSRAMIRPRVGGFVYSEAEIEVMRRDIDAVRQAGLAGVVFGANLEDGRLDEDALRVLVDQAAGLEIALHRSIDLTPDPLAAMEIAVEFGFDTILTSGGRNTAADGCETIAAMQRQALGRIEILAGGGVKPDNVAALIAATGVRSVHGSCSAPYRDAEPRAEAFGFVSADAKDTKIGQVRAMRTALHLISV
jgi:copper homeostasis protein